jgi:hypothetical protein
VRSNFQVSQSPLVSWHTDKGMLEAGPLDGFDQASFVVLGNLWRLVVEGRFIAFSFGLLAGGGLLLRLVGRIFLAQSSIQQVRSILVAFSGLARSRGASGRFGRYRILSKGRGSLLASSHLGDSKNGRVEGRAICGSLRPFESLSKTPFASEYAVCTTYALISLLTRNVCNEN